MLLLDNECIVILSVLVTTGYHRLVSHVFYQYVKINQIIIIIIIINAQNLSGSQFSVPKTFRTGQFSVHNIFPGSHFSVHC